MFLQEEDGWFSRRLLLKHEAMDRSIKLLHGKPPLSWALLPTAAKFKLGF